MRSFLKNNSERNATLFFFLLKAFQSNKADEFYTQLNDIELELKHYKEQFIHDMKTRPGMINALNDIEKKAKEADVLLICFCSDVNLCHRGLIADEMASRGVIVSKN